MASLCIGFLAIMQNSCAVLFKVQLSDIDGPAAKGHIISVKASETTVDLAEVASISKNLGRSTKSKGLGQAGEGIDTYLALFQMGPKTGAPVYNEFYVRSVTEDLVAQCKNGRLTNIISVREAREYPVIKGQIVRIDALCQQSH